MVEELGRKEGLRRWGGGVPCIVPDSNIAAPPVALFPVCPGYFRTHAMPRRYACPESRAQGPSITPNTTEQRGVALSVGVDGRVKRRDGSMAWVACLAS